MTGIELLTLIPGSFELLGIYLLGRKVRFGFISNLIAGVLWITYSLYTGQAIGLLMVCGIGLILNTKGFRQWQKNQESKEH